VDIERQIVRGGGDEVGTIGQISVEAQICDRSSLNCRWETDTYDSRDCVVFDAYQS
jgi:hypothetical protein